MDGRRSNLTNHTDEQLLTAHLAGDRQAFAELVVRYQHDLFHFLARFLGDRTAADDVFQEAFIQVCQSARQFEPGRNFRPWLFTIAANKARDYLRARNRHPMAPLQALINPSQDDGHQFVDLVGSAKNGPTERLEHAEMEHRVQDAIRKMPEHLREVLVLAYFNQFPYRQIADMLNVPLGTVKSRLHAAVENFAEIWKSANPIVA